MPPGPVPTPVTAYSSGFLHINPYVEHYIDETLQWLGVMAAETDTWRHLQVRFHWSGATELHDDCWCTFDVSNITGGAIDNSWTTADFTTVEAKFDLFFGQVMGLTMSQISVTEYRWYLASFNTPDNPKPFAEHGPPVRVTTKAIAGTATGGPTSPQTAMSITWKTPYPRNWGRTYIPGIAPVSMNPAYPRFTNTYVDQMAAAGNTLVTQLASSDFQLVVPVTRLGPGGRGDPGLGAVNRRLTNITQVQVDNVPDVIRRRRPFSKTYAKTYP